MIVANTPKERNFNLAFTVKKYVPEKMLRNRINPVKVTAKINGKETKIEIHDIHLELFHRLPLIDFIIRTGTDQTAETIQKGLIQRYGNAIKSTMIYVVLYKIVGK